MKELINAVQISLQNHNWYGALFIALSLPDICGKLEDPTLKSEERYVAWFNKYLAGEYTKGIGPFEQYVVTFLTGEDCYALRCAYLHEGREKISDQKCQRVLDDFRFTTDPSHRNYFDTGQHRTLQLNVESFCKEICTGVDQWLKDVAPNQGVQERIPQMLVIHDSIFTKDSTGAHIP